MDKGDVIEDVVKVKGLSGRSRNATQSQSSVDVANQWQTKLSYDVRLRVLDVCKEFYETVRYDWKL